MHFCHAFVGIILHFVMLDQTNLHCYQKKSLLQDRLSLKRCNRNKYEHSPSPVTRAPAFLLLWSIPHAAHRSVRRAAGIGQCKHLLSAEVKIRGEEQWVTAFVPDKQQSVFIEWRPEHRRRMMTGRGNPRIVLNIVYLPSCVNSVADTRGKCAHAHAVRVKIHPKRRGGSVLHKE